MNWIEAAPLLTLLGVIITLLITSINLRKTHSQNEKLKRLEIEHQNGITILNSSLQAINQTKARMHSYKLDKQLDLASELYTAILEFQESVWAYWGPFSDEVRPKIFGGKDLDERAEDVYNQAQNLRAKYYRCHIKFKYEQIKPVDKLINLISMAKLNFNFPDKRALAEYWIKDQFQKSYEVFFNALDSLENITLEDESAT